MRINVFKTTVVAGLGLLAGQHGDAQGTFLNLNFESPILPLTSPVPGLVPATNALPGWTVYLSGNPTDFVFYPEVPIGSPSIALVNSQTQFYPSIQGNYSVFFRGAGLGQTGQIPNNVAALLFLRDPSAFFLASFGGQNIPLVQFGTSGNNIIMAGNISMFAGQTGELLFSGGGLFDAIQFSSTPSPEPGKISLFVVGALFLGWRRTVRSP